MIFVLKMLFTFVYDRFNWSLLIIRYSLLITRNTNTLKLIVFTVYEPEYMNMGPLKYRSSAVLVQYTVQQLALFQLKCFCTTLIYIIILKHVLYFK